MKTNGEYASEYNGQKKKKKSLNRVARMRKHGERRADGGIVPGAVDGPLHDFDVLAAGRPGLVQFQHGPLHDRLERETPTFRVLVHQALSRNKHAEL